MGTFFIPNSVMEDMRKVIKGADFMDLPEPNRKQPFFHSSYPPSLKDLRTLYGTIPPVEKEKEDDDDRA